VPLLTCTSAPTEDEVTQDTARGAAVADAREIHEVMEQAGHGFGGASGWRTLPPEARAATITSHYGTAGSAGTAGATLILTTGGEWILQHPGWYDDFAHTERVLTDPALITRARTLLAGGDRDSTYHDQLTYWYTVRVHTTQTHHAQPNNDTPEVADGGP
jgi:hypothetical protein